MNKKRIALAITIERRKERKQFCAFSAHARFHTAWVIFGSRAVQLRGLLYPRERTSSAWSLRSEKCHKPKSHDFVRRRMQACRRDRQAEGRILLGFSKRCAERREVRLRLAIIMAFPA